MKLAGISVLPEVDPGKPPFWRQVLRGFSQCAFQTNELTALFFIITATLFNWRMGAAHVVSVVLATIVAKLSRGNPELLGLGLYGFNSGLMGLALANFFQPDLALWCRVRSGRTGRCRHHRDGPLAADSDSGRTLHRDVLGTLAVRGSHGFGEG